MPSVFDHELSAYLREIKQLDDEAGIAYTAVNDGENLTHLSLGLSNRANMVLVGLCGLVEAFLTGIAKQQESDTPFKLDDIRGQGRSKLEIFLKRTGAIDLKLLPHWAKFNNLYQVRNVIVHGHGGLAPARSLKNLKTALRELDLQDVLVGDRRVRMTTRSLVSAHGIAKMLISEISSSI